MDRIAKFFRVSREQFDADGGKNYDEIQMPRRATAGSAGYDFFLTEDFALAPHARTTMPTGLRCKIQKGYVLFIMPKSGLGRRYMLQLPNTIGVVDSDYYDADNEGHLLVPLVNNGDEEVILKKGAAFVQGIFLPFGVTEDDDAVAPRKGGFGSTSL